jgi:hypothetical protein
MFPQCGYIGAPQRIRNPDKLLEVAVKRIFAHECKLNGRTSIRERERREIVAERLVHYKKHLVLLKDIDTRKKALDPSTRMVKKKLKENMNREIKQFSSVNARLRFSKEDLKTRIDCNQISDEAIAKSNVVIDEMRQQFYEARLELKISQAAFRAFQTFDTKFESCEELVRAKQKRDAVVPAFKRLRKSFAKAHRRFKKEYSDMGFEELEGYDKLKVHYAAVYAEKCYFQYEYEKVKVRVMGRLISQLERTRFKTDTELKVLVESLTEEAREVETELYHNEMKAMLSKKSAIARPSATPVERAESVIDNWESIEDDGTDAAYEELVEENDAIVDSDVDEDDEENEDENENEAGA